MIFLGNKLYPESAVLPLDDSPIFNNFRYLDKYLYYHKPSKTVNESRFSVVTQNESLPDFRFCARMIKVKCGG
jgi:hypothetical protein